MTHIDTKAAHITDLDYVAEEARASLELIRSAAQHIGQLTAIRTRFEDMARQYDLMNERTEQARVTLQDASTFIAALEQSSAALIQSLGDERTQSGLWLKDQERELQRTAEVLRSRWQEQAAKSERWQNEFKRDMEALLDRAEQHRTEALQAAQQELLRQQRRQEEKMEQKFQTLTGDLHTQQAEHQKQLAAMNAAVSTLRADLRRTKRKTGQLMIFQVLLAVVLAATTWVNLLR
ncbi:hypothetical protein [Deinococcus sedimenti]|uniref:Uncharacterized protein n=1 Tax=Deinococcus sedimenti TaxID=1867090 RepID=A0ABQ2S7K2_9DEIO|nr:hypothetical protein [Deinococcus sedimenti]GGS05578.1 hypothetical protein GCM10008960_35090 [Deinococcus sedimenti]